MTSLGRALAPFGIPSMLVRSARHGSSVVAKLREEAHEVRHDHVTTPSWFWSVGRRWMCSNVLANAAHSVRHGALTLAWAS